MTRALCRAVYAVARYLTGPEHDILIWDPRHGAVAPLAGVVERSRIDVYDLEDRCHLCGPGHRGTFTLYDFGESSRLTLKIRADQYFEGHHERGNVRFTGRLRPGGIELFDYGSWEYVHYAIEARARPPANGHAPRGTLRRRTPAQDAAPPAPARRPVRVADDGSATRDLDRVGRVGPTVTRGGWPVTVDAPLLDARPHRDATRVGRDATAGRGTAPMP